LKAEVVRLVVGPLETNCYIVADVASGTAAVIDPGDETWRIEHELAMREWTLEWVLVTHAHFDHIAACGELAVKHNATIALHPADLPPWWLHGYADTFGIQIPDLPTPTRSLSESEPVLLGGLRIDILHLPGHSAGHVGFYMQEMGWLFCGDVVFAGGGRGRTDLPSGDEQALLDSILHKVWSLPDSTILYPGHGESSEIGIEKRNWGTAHSAV
jgi:hydroxyacylglutathione hydrolase